MFSVICTRDDKQLPIFGGPCLSLLKFGEKYSVIDVVRGPDGKEYYVLAEFSEKYAFCHVYFSPCSNIDERDRLEAWQSERLTQEDRMLMALAEHMPDEQLDPVAEARIWKVIKSTL